MAPASGLALDGSQEEHVRFRPEDVETIGGTGRKSPFARNVYRQCREQSPDSASFTRASNDGKGEPAAGRFVAGTEGSPPPETFCIDA